MIKENLNEAMERICKIFNSIRTKNMYIFYSNYKYKEIKEMNIEEIGKYGQLFDFIYWLVSDNIKFQEKLESLDRIFNKMGISNLISYLIDTPLKEELKQDLKIKEGKEGEEIDKNKKKKKKKKRKKNNSPLESMELIQDDDKEQNEEKVEEGNIDLSPIAYYNIIIEMRRLLKQRYELMEKYKFNISKFFRGIDKSKYKENIKKCFPSFDEKEFNKKVKEQMTVKIDDGKSIKGKELSETKFRQAIQEYFLLLASNFQI